MIEIITLIGVVIAVMQLYQNNRIKRGEFINSLYDKLINDHNLIMTMTKMDYNGSWYGRDFHGSHFESDVDILFKYLSFICYLKERRLISQKDMKLFEYIIIRTCLSFQSIEYLWNLYHFSKKCTIECPFMPIIRYGENREMITSDFYNSKSKLFNKYLNF